MKEEKLKSIKNSLTSSKKSSIESNTTSLSEEKKDTEGKDESNPALLADLTQNISELKVNDTITPIENTSLDWICQVCTAINLPSLNVCMVCECAREGAGSSVSDTTSGAGWWCARCTCINALTATRCAACDADMEGRWATDHTNQTGDAEENNNENDYAEEEEEEEEEEDEDEEDNDEIEEEEEEEDHSDVEEDDNEEDDERNSSERNEHEIDLLGSGSHSLPLSDHAIETTTKMKGGDKTALDLAADKSVSDHIKLVITGSFTNKTKFITRLEASILDGKVPFSNMINRLGKWTAKADSVLLEHLNTESIVKKDIFKSPYLIALPKQTYMYQASDIQDLDILDVFIRSLVFDSFNKALHDILPKINCSNPDPLSLGATIRQFNRYIFRSTKQPILDKAIESSTVASSPGLPASIILDNFKALASRDRGEIDPVLSHCCFCQAFRFLNSKDSKIFRYLFSGDRVLQITYNGESGIDAGGISIFLQS